MKLGKKLGVVQDPRTAHFKAFIDQLPKAPPASRYSRDVGSWPMFANDRYGDCTCASQAHRVLLQERNSRQRETQVTEEDVLEAYSAVTGFNRATGANDNGAYLLDVLNFMRRQGMGREKDGSPHTISAYVKLDHTHLDEVRVGSWMFGGLYLGIWLPLSAQDQDVWDVTTKDSEPGSWGGHAVWMTGYDARYVHFVTWGEHRRMTWRFFGAYVDEAYAVISEDFLRSGKTARGFDVEALNRYLAQLG